MYSNINYLYLKEHNVFKGLTKDQLYEVLKYVKFSRKRKPELIRMSETKCPFIYFLIKGKLKISEIDKSGNSLIKEVEKEGGVFGSFETGTQNRYEFGQALTSEVIYFYLGSSEFALLCQSIPQLALNFSLLITSKLRKSENRYSHLVFQNVKTRLVYFFKTWAKEEGNQNGSEIIIKNYLTHNDIAEIISTCRQTVTSILNDLKANGYISYSRKEIVISNLSRLENAA